MTLTLLNSTASPRAMLVSTSTTVPNSGASGAVNDLMTSSIGDCIIEAARAQITGIATLDTLADILASGILINVIDPASSIHDIIGVDRWKLTGTDRVDAFIDCSFRQPLMLSTYGIRSVFANPDVNATATGALSIVLSVRRLRQP